MLIAQDLVPKNANNHNEEALEDYHAAWQNITASLQDKFGLATCKSWIEPLQFLENNGSIITLAAPTKFIRQWVLSHFEADILAAWQNINPQIMAIHIVIRKNAEETKPKPTHQAKAQIYNIKQADETGINQELGATLDPRLTFDEFVVGKPNELAYAAARRVSEAGDVARGMNPLFLYGGVGLGKTHLMHAIAWQVLKDSPHKKVVYLSAERFMNLYVSAIRHKDTTTFRERLRCVDILMIDDIQFICGKDSTQEEFFHTFNAIIDNNRQLVISADRSPTSLDGIEDRIRSRLGWGLVADIHESSYELRLGILEAKCEKMSVNVPKEVRQFLATKITSNIRELEGALNRLVAHATLVGREINLETTEHVLRDMLKSLSRKVTIEEIQKKVAEFYNIKLADMHSGRRSRTIARPRQVAMYLAKKLTTKSLPEIGKKFGGKDHTTVIHAVKKINELMLIDNEICEQIELLTRILEA